MMKQQCDFRQAAWRKVGNGGSSLLWLMMCVFFFFSNPVAADDTKIHCLGDSITEGFSDYRKSWRYHLWKELTDNGYTAIDFVGSDRGTRHNNLIDDAIWDQENQDHDGHWSADADDILNGPLPHGDDGNLKIWAPLYQPDIGIIFLGTNDIRRDTTADTIVHTRFKGIIDELRAANSDVVILVAQIPFWDFERYGGSQTAVEEFNTKVLELVTSYSTSSSPIEIVDLNTGYTLDDHRDGIHPDIDGAEKIAPRWYDALIPYLTLPMNPEPTTSPSVSPSDTPSFTPSNHPSDSPSDSPSGRPSNMVPSDTPSNYPSDVPSFMPSSIPSDAPSGGPTGPTNDDDDGLNLSTGTVSNVDDTWQTVTLPNTYTSMVVVATPIYSLPADPAVVRIRNAEAGNTFEIRLQNPSGVTLSGMTYDVAYVVVEEGVYTVAEHGVKLEAVKVLSTRTARKRKWGLVDRQTYSNTYTSPVVVGQVMTANDNAWSAFWCRGPSRKAAPDSTYLYVGKMVAEDTVHDRADETLGYIVMEAGISAAVGTKTLVAGVGSDSVRGMGNGPVTYSVSGLGTLDSAVLAIAGMDGGEGAWPVHQAAPTTSTLTLVVDEDLISDSERYHTTEDIAYLLVGTAGMGRVGSSTSTEAGTQKQGVNNVTVQEAPPPLPPRPRVVVTTDGERDDQASMVRFLLHANMFEIEGIIHSSSKHHWAGNDSIPEFRWRGFEWLDDRIDYYETAYPTLSQNEAGFPTADELRQKVFVGNIVDENEMTEVTEGSEWIVEVLLDDSKPGPIWLQCWGGTNTIARALKTIQDDYPERVAEVSDKAIIYMIADQDTTYEGYVRPNWPNLLTLKSKPQYAVLAYAWEGKMPDNITKSYFEAPWMMTNILNDHGPLCAIYNVNDDGSFMSEGDSPAFMHQMDVGLRSLEDPTYGGWGGRFDGGPDAHRDDARDDGSIFFPISRWAIAFQNEMAARCDWCVKSSDQANHPPIVSLANALDRTAVTGDTIELDASPSSDPDGDELTYRWFQYYDVDTYEGLITINDEESSVASFTVPNDANPGDTIHIILEVTDQGAPNLTRYARIIVTVVDQTVWNNQTVASRKRTPMIRRATSMVVGPDDKP